MRLSINIVTNENIAYFDSAMFSYTELFDRQRNVIHGANASRLIKL